MPTLSKRATLNQRKLLRVIEGSCKNASDAHPDRAISKSMARSVAKRAVGTISALMPDLLVAARTPSSNGVPVGLCPASQHFGHTKPCPECSRRSQYVKIMAKRGGGLKQVGPFRSLLRSLSSELGNLKKTDPIRAQIHIDLLRQISAEMRKL